MADTTSLILLFAIAWAIAAAWFQDSRFAFVVWFPLLATATIILALALVTLSQVSFVPGPTAPLYGVAVAQVVGYLIMAVVILTWCVHTRPRKGGYSLRIVIPTVLGYLAAVGVLYFLTRRA